MKAVEKGAGVSRLGVFQATLGQRLLEFGQIARDQPGVEPQVPGAEQHVLRAEVLPQRVDRLIEASPRPLILGLGPEVRHQLFAGETLFAGSGEQGQDRQATGLRGRAAHETVGPAHVQPSERANLQHVTLVIQE
jgi:hypothetical protein